MTFAFIETLKRLLASPALSTTNTVYDASMASYVADRVNVLTPDVVSWLGASDAVTSGSSSPTGSLVPNVNKSSLDLDIDGFEMRLSKFRDGLQSTPRRVRRRRPTDALFVTPSDRVRYLLADPTDGVLLLDQNLEIVRTFPNLIASGTVTGSQYRNAQCAVACTIGATELMVIACGAPQHVVQILNYDTGGLVATIGTPGVAGLPDAGPVRLDDPVSVAVDEVNERLFIACRSGQPLTATGDNGFVCEFDISTPASPVFVQFHLYDSGLSRLNNGQCFQPSDVIHTPAGAGVGAPPARLWVANGLGDVAAFTRADPADPFIPTLVVEAQGPNYVLGPDKVSVPSNEYAENALDVLTGSDNITRLYVAASRTAKVEVFRASSSAATPFGAHEKTYGYRRIETTMPYGTSLRVHSNPNLLEPPLTYATFSSATGVAADEVVLPGEAAPVSVLLVADADAGRVQRLRLPVYTDDNTVTFSPSSSDIPIHVLGWFVPADSSFPPEYLVLEVRDPGDATVTPAVPASGWRRVPRAGFSVPVQGPAMTRYQFRLRATLPSTAPIAAYSTGAVGVLIRQVW